MPNPATVVNQKKIIEELLTQQVDGIAISPINPDNQGDILQEIASQTTLITHDSDAPKSPRKCYIGMSNYDAGRNCGKLVKQALPDGGSVMLYVGRLGQLNAQQRRQGLIDELLGRDHDESRYDPPEGEIKGDKYVILDTYTDDFDRAKAKRVAENSLTKYPDLGCMVGLFAYNPPILLQVLTEAKRLDKVQIVAFDEDDETLQGIVDGHIIGTIVQNPYQYGYKSVEVLAKLARGEKDAYPESGYIEFKDRTITSENVKEFWEEKKRLTGKK
jgi:ribose transport system substrate-binding protein